MKVYCLLLGLVMKTTFITMSEPGKFYVQVALSNKEETLYMSANPDGKIYVQNKVCVQF